MTSVCRTPTSLWQRNIVRSAVAFVLANSWCVQQTFAAECTSTITGTIGNCEITTTSSVTVSQHGTVYTSTSATNDSATAIDLHYADGGDGNDASLTNHGLIAVDTSAPDDTYTTGYGVASSDVFHGTLINNGTIRVNASEAYGILTQDGLAGTVTNNGLVATQASSIAHSVHINNDVTGALTNNGSLSASAVNAYNAEATSIYVGNIIGSLSNHGQITASSSAMTGQSLAYGLNIGSIEAGGVLLNHGNLSANALGGSLDDAFGTSYADATAHGIHVSDLFGTMTNAGSIIAKASAAPGGQSYAYGFSTDSANGGLTGTFNNACEISGTADHAADGYSLYIGDSSGVINNLASGLLRGNISLQSTGTFNNAGTLFIPVIGNVGAEGDISGTFNQTGNGLIKLGAFSNVVTTMPDPISGDPVTTRAYSTLSITGDTNITSGNAISVRASVNHQLQVGDTLADILNTDVSTLSGYSSGDSINITGTPLFTFAGQVDNDGNVDVTVTAIKTFAQVLGPLGQASLGNTLDGFVSTYTGTGKNDPLLDALYNLDNLTGLQQAVQELQPLMAAGMARVTLNSLRDANRIIQGRQEVNRGLAYDDDFTTEDGFWLKPFGTQARQDNNDGVFGYGAKSYGILAGIDGTTSELTRVGAALAFAQTDIDARHSGADQSADITSYRIFLYGSHTLEDHPRTETNFQIDYGIHDNDGKREISFLKNCNCSNHPNAVAKADYDSWSLHIGLGIGHAYELSPKLAFLPSARLDYTHLHEDSYKESVSGNIFKNGVYTADGVEAVGLSVKSNRLNELMMSLGSKLQYALTDKTVLSANLGIGYDFLDERNKLYAAFIGGGGRFETLEIDQSPWLVRAGLGLSTSSDSAVQISARYDYEARTNYNNQTASFKMSVPF